MSSPVPFHPQPAVGRVLPHSIEAEEYLLSTILLDGAPMLERAQSAKIRPTTFYDTKHAIIFEAMERMHAAGVPIEAATLAQHLRDNRLLDQVGGFAFITQISSVIPTTAGAHEFIRKVSDLATVRAIILAATSAVEDAYNYTGDLPELAADVRRRLEFATEGPRGLHSWPPPISAADLCLHPPETPPILIDGILYSVGTMLLAGPSKAHKTFSALEVAIAIASGTPWLDFKTTKSPVLYLNLELQDFATEERIAKICSARGMPPPPLLHILNLRGKTVTYDQLATNLPLMIRKTGARAVAIDPHYKISAVSGMEENSNDSTGKLLGNMENLCAPAKAALILTHHFAKGDASTKNAIDRASGGGVFARWGDVMMTFTPHEEGEAMTIEMSLRNFAPIKPFVVRWVYPRWVRDKALDPAKLHSTRGPTRISPDSLLQCLSTQLLTYSEWLKASGMTASTFQRKKDELIAAGKVIQQGVCYRSVS